MSEKPISPMRQRMLEDMNMRRFVPDTQREYIRAVMRLATFLGRSPDTATPAAEAAVEIDAAAAQRLAQPCPCCGGRMFVIETFDAGCQPRYRPTAMRIDTS
jgi:hypothetical protein